MTPALANSAETRRLLRILAVLLALVVPQAAMAQLLPGLPGGGQAPASEAAATPLDTLLEVLKDDAAREALIAELEARTAEGGAAAQPTSEPVTLGSRIGDLTQGAAESVAGSLVDLWQEIQAIPAVFAALASADYRAVGLPLLNLALLVIITYGAYFGIRFLTERFRWRLNRHAARSGWFSRLAASLAVLAANLAIIAAAWAVGNVVAITLIGPAGNLAFHLSLFLNAFLVVEVAQALVRAVLAPRRPELRFPPLTDATAKMLTLWCRGIVSVLAFGQLLLAPVFARYVSAGTGQAIGVLVYLAALTMMVMLVLRLRARVTVWLSDRASNTHGVLPVLAQYWHVPVLAYLFALFLVVIIWPGAVLEAMLVATGKVLAAVVLGVIIAGLLSRLIMGGVKLPNRLSSRIPLLEQRLNSFVPRALTVLRVLVVIIVAAITLDAIGLFSISRWLESGFGGRVAGATVTVALILVIAFGVWLALSSWVDYRLQPENGTRVKARERTLLVLLRNAATVTIVVFTLMFTLSEVGLSIAPLLASAGVIGLAVGFGAQKLVQDIITGIFIQLEGAIDVGDIVNIGGISGTVERLNIRSAGLRDLDGAYHIVPFSSVTTVTNFMRGFAFAVCDVRVAYRENLDEAKKAMTDAFEALKQDPEIAPNIVDPELEWMGLNTFLDSAVVLRARIKTLPGYQWAVNRAYNAEVKRVFDERGIEIPYPHQTVYFGEDKSGRAAPLHLVTGGRGRREAGEGAAGGEPRPEEKPAPRRRRTTKRRKPEVPDNDYTPPEGEH
jgi:small-conductance mechanosensitive channel